MCNLIFDVRIDFLIKARMVVNREMPKVPLNLNYYYVVSMNSFHLPFLVSGINNFYICHVM